MDTYKQLHFDSASTYATWFEATRKADPVTRYMGYGLGDQHTIGTAGLNILRNGNEQYVQQANDLLDEFQEQLDVPSLTWQLNVAGGFPNVGAYLANDPLNMWSREPDLSDRTPLRVWVGVATSGSIPDALIAKRGCTLAAFAIAMAPHRPVIITPYVEIGDMEYRSRNKRGAVISWDIQTSPIVLSELMGCLAHSEVTRYVGMEACQRLLGPAASHDGGWHPDAFNENKMRERLGCAPDDLYLPGLHSTDSTIDNPLAWLRKMIDRYVDPDTTDYDRDATTIDDPNGLGDWR